MHPQERKKTQTKKHIFYKTLNNRQTKVQKKRPTYTGGDFNARVQTKQTENEHCIGKHTFDKNNITLVSQDEDVVENRNMFVSHCNITNTIAVNTFFDKPDNKKPTFRYSTTTHGPPWTRENLYETLDYILVQNKWKNTVKNIEVDREVIDSDHYPVIAKIRIELKVVSDVDFCSDVGQCRPMSANVAQRRPLFGNPF